MVAADRRSQTPGIMHLIDSLNAGGAERVAVNIVNHLPRDRFEPHLCTTRRDGLLSVDVMPDVKRISLNRRFRFDPVAVLRLTHYIKKQNIRILHAHSTSLFIASIASLFPPLPSVIWHDHFGRYAIEERPVWLYRFVARRAKGVLAVNEQLATWAKEKLHVSRELISYVPNFVCSPGKEAIFPSIDLPGQKGYRIVNVANIRPQKDHLTLIQAMAIVAREVPRAHLLIIGDGSNAEDLRRLREEITSLNLDGNVTLLGQRGDVHAILKQCDIGVLSSKSEGLPLALIEYGMAGLASVATNVGQCPEVLLNGQAGLLVPAGSPKEIAAGLVELLKNPEKRNTLGENFRRHVQINYSMERVLDKICSIYYYVLNSTKR